MTDALVQSLTVGGLALTLVCAAAQPAAAQNYSDWSVPQNLGTVVNSASNDQHPAITPDGLTLYFVSDRPGGVGNLDLWMTHRDDVDAPWSPPAPLASPVNSAFAEFAPTFGAAGHLLFFSSERPGGCGGRDIWMSFRSNKRDDAGWQTPTNLGCALNFAGFDDGATYFEDEHGLVTIYFTSQNRPGGLGDFDIWASTMNPDGTFNPAINISELNSTARDTRTAIARNGLEILFTSQRPGALAGSLDLYRSTRETTSSTWSTPSPLTAINTTFNDGAPALSFDGTTLIFYSNRPGGSGANDLWIATRHKLRGHEK
jgi:hypothetical protein